MTQTYRVKPGCTFGARGDITAGDLVHLTEAEARAFADKLELVEDAPAAAQADALVADPDCDSKKRKG